MQEFWQEWYKDNETPYLVPDDTMIKIVSSLRPGKAADLGAGEGNNSFWLADRGWQVTAVDFAPAAIEYIKNVARERGLSIVAQVGDVTCFDPEEKQDLVLLGYMHLDPADRKQMLDHAARALAPGGILLYLGITGMEAHAEEEQGVDPRIFAHAVEVVADLEELTIERAEEGPRMIDVGDGGGETEVTGVTVLARKPPI